MTGRLLAALSAAMLLAACVPSDIVPQQKEISGKSLGLGNEPAPPVNEDWWTAFADPELDRLVNDALADNPDLGVALARLRLAKAGVEEADSALYPHIDFNGKEQRERLSDVYLYPPPYKGSFRWLGTIEADLSWDIDFWGKEAAALDKAKSLQDAARLNVAAARLAVAGAVVQAYIDLDRACKLVEIARQNEQDRQDTLDLTTRRMRDGLDSEVEVQEAEALLAQAREAKVRADSARDIVVHELAALAGHGAEAYSAIVAPHLNLEAALPLPAELPADLLARRPDVLAARARIDAAVSGRKEAKAAFYPDVNLLASAGWAAIGLGPLLESRALQYGGGPAVHLPIFDAGELRAQYSGATADIDLAVADYNAALLAAVRQTADALTRIRAIAGEETEHRRMLDAAKKGYGLAQTRYRTGLTNQLTVLNAQTVLFDAREGEVSLDADGADQRVALILSIGGGFAAEKSAQASAH